MTIETRFITIIAQASGIDATKIGPLHTLDSLGLDSLDKVQLAMTLEDEFHIILPDSEVDNPELGTVGGLLSHVQNKVDERGERFARFGVLPGATPGPSLPIVAQRDGTAVGMRLGDIIERHPDAFEARLCKGPMTLAEIMEAESPASATTTPIQTMIATASASTGTLELTESYVALVNVTNSGVIEPHGESIPQQVREDQENTSRETRRLLDEASAPGLGLPLSNLFLIAEEAAAPARLAFRRAFDAGYYAGVADRGLPDPEPSWLAYAEKEGLLL